MESALTPDPPGANGANGASTLPPPNPDRRRSPLRRIVVHLERTFAAGVLVMLPIGITALVFKFLYDLLTPILTPLTNLLPGPEIHGAGLFALMILIYVVGLVAAFVLGRRIIALGHRILEFIPLVKGIYGTTRTAVQLLSNGYRMDSGDKYRGVVLIEFPRPGIVSIGLVTSQMMDEDGEEILSVYIPTTPIPSSGFLVMVPGDQVTHTDMTVEDAMSVVVSGGILSDRVFQRSGVEVPGDLSSNQ